MKACSIFFPQKSLLKNALSFKESENNVESQHLFYLIPYHSSSVIFKLEYYLIGILSNKNYLKRFELIFPKKYSQHCMIRAAGYECIFVHLPNLDRYSLFQSFLCLISVLFPSWLRKVELHYTNILLFYSETHSSLKAKNISIFSFKSITYYWKRLCLWEQLQTSFICKVFYVVLHKIAHHTL